jgi:hypothetical protein
MKNQLLEKLNLLQAADLDPDYPILTEAPAFALAPHSTIMSRDNLRSSSSRQSNHLSPFPLW